MPKFLDDKAIRGSMTDLFYKTLGVESAQFSLRRPELPGLARILFRQRVRGPVHGRLQPRRTPRRSPATSRSATPTAPSPPRPPPQYTAGATIQIGAGATAEVVIIGSTAASNVVNFASSSGGAGTRCGSPTHRADRPDLRHAIHPQVGRTQLAARLRRCLRCAAADAHAVRCHQHRQHVHERDLRDCPDQHLRGPACTPAPCSRASTSAATPSSSSAIKMAGDSWLSQVAGTAVTNVTTNSGRSRTGTPPSRSSGTNITQIGNFTLSVKRATQVYWTVAGHPDARHHRPRAAHHGRVDRVGPDQTEQPLDMMLLNAQGPMMHRRRRTPASRTAAPRSRSPSR